MNKCFGMHGWREFRQNRKDILAEFDRLREITQNRPVQMAHGQGVEAYLRKWLSEFLPKKWAITSGYVIPILYKDNIKLYHYDIIIYDCLNAPVLWTEGNQDDSVQGKSRAIPAKNVAAILEVKSRLNRKSVQDMVNKLLEIDRFKDQLPDTFFSSGIFVDLREEDNGQSAILESMIQFGVVHRFMGAMVLRYEGDESATGVVRLFADDGDNSNTNASKLARPIDDLAIHMTEDGSVQMSERGAGVIAVATDDHTWSMSKVYSSFMSRDGLSANIAWSHSGFAEFCIDMVSLLDGLSYSDQNRPSFGRIFDSFERKPVESQPAEKVDGMPFLHVAIVELEDGSRVKMDDVDDGIEISFCMHVSNVGDTGAVLSDDHFKNRLALPAGQTGAKVTKIKALPKDGKGDMAKVRKELADDGVVIPYRVSYFPSEGEKVFYAIEKRIRVRKDSIAFESEDGTP
ncbi:MAG: hypothetical protein NW701_06250 [Nitrospira sp.]